MTISDYELITGLLVPTSREALVTAQIGRTRRILESMLGFTLLDADINDNQYVESGKSSTECPCPSTTLTLTAADAVVTAYRLYPYYKNDKFLMIDPASAINSVKLVYDDVTYKTLETDEFRPHSQSGFIKYLEQVECWCSCTNCDCKFVQLAVDAVWLWTDATLPDGLKDVWADMVTYYSNQKKDIKSETLGSHSYTKFDGKPPELQGDNFAVILKYSGPLGTVRRSVTL